jgi:hypothetical protein
MIRLVQESELEMGSSKAFSLVDAATYSYIITQNQAIHSADTNFKTG